MIYKNQDLNKIVYIAGLDSVKILTYYKLVLNCGTAISNSKYN